MLENFTKNFFFLSIFNIFSWKDIFYVECLWVQEEKKSFVVVDDFSKVIQGFRINLQYTHILSVITEHMSVTPKNYTKEIIFY